MEEDNDNNGGAGQGQGQGQGPQPPHAVVREAQAYLERLAMSCENRAVPTDGERAEVRGWVRAPSPKSLGPGPDRTNIYTNTLPMSQHAPSGGWAGPMTAAEISRLYRELLRLREDGGPGA